MRGHGAMGSIYFFFVSILLFSFTNASANLRLTALSKTEAIVRSHQVSHISYQLWFSLDDRTENFKGRTVVHFDLKPKAGSFGKTVFIDLEEASLSSLTVNGVAFKDFNFPQRYDGHHIYFKPGELKTTGNRIEISYSHPYSTNGSGFYRFKDPSDGRVYLYSNFEPYDAHKMFPSFDQPDLKASYELTVEAPEDWEVISNTLERQISKSAGKKTWTFPPSPVFSTYVFALIAGPYSVWKSDMNDIPLRLFARKSLAKYIDHDEWLKITKEGLEFYNIQFGFPYPFAKYDQIIVPDFNAGAMENVGAVTFSENYIYRTKVTKDRKMGRADTILHEMAHMWFGDLVTMRWWDGLWLNESFATFMSAWATDKAAHFTDSWQAFFAHTKEWAYWEDQLVTTHPIDLPVVDTEHAEANFDGITYGKGASVLKQLSFYLGEDDFREGLQRYFQKYSYKNTSLKEFIRMLSEASSQNLAHWQQVWLQMAGLNTIQADWACENDPETQKSKISKFNLIQTSPSNGPSAQLRPHKTKIALFYFPKHSFLWKGPLTPDKVLDVTYSQANTPVSQAVGKPCPNFVFPNYLDYDYVKVELDEPSLKLISKHMSHLPDNLTRQMVWYTLWEMVMDGKIRPQDYADSVLNQANNEKDTLILSSILRTLNSPTVHQDSVLKFLNGDLQGRYHKKIENFIWNHLSNAPAGTDLQLIWYQSFLNIASSSSSIQFLKGLLTGKRKLREFKVDQERRWNIIQTLARNGVPKVKEMIQTELQADPTDMGEKSAIATEVSIPDASIKNKWLSEVTRSRRVTSPSQTPSPGSTPTSLPTPTPTSTPTPAITATAVTLVPPAPLATPSQPPLSLAKLREAMWNYQILGQAEFTKASVNSYFDILPKLALSPSLEDQEYAGVFAHAMFPSLCDTDIIQRTDHLLNTYSNLPAPVVKSLKVAKQEEERCIQAREASQRSK